jgi:hypothetical protein
MYPSRAGNYLHRTIQMGVPNNYIAGIPGPSEQPWIRCCTKQCGPESDVGLGLFQVSPLSIVMIVQH